MAADLASSTRIVGWLRWVARILLGGWAVFWVWFNLASGLDEMPKEGLGAASAHLLVGGLILAMTVAAWRWDLAGGIALLLLGAFGAWYFRTTPLVGLLLLAPPLVGGLLLVIVGILARKGGSRPLAVPGP